MKNILNTLFLSIQSKFLPLLRKLRLLFNPTFWRVQVLNKLKIFFMKLFNVKPKDKNDYYTIARWMISKKLAFAIIIALGIIATAYIVIMSPVMGAINEMEKGGSSIPTYGYRALPLKFHKGQVNILGEGKYLAYSGSVEGGYCKGQGTLYDKTGAVVYMGTFDKSMYNGTGTYYYPTGTPLYVGEFVDNIYSGKGTTFFPNGSTQYKGNFALGNRSGAGELFNDSGNPIYVGNFNAGRVMYEEFIGKTTKEVASIYTGRNIVYIADKEYAVDMAEIGAVYKTNEPATSLTNEATVTEVYICASTFPAPTGMEVDTINGLTEALGEPIYTGSTYVVLPEAVAINASPAEARPTGTIDITSTTSFEDVHNVQKYDKNVEVYIYTYTVGNLTYTFYCENSTRPFFMYSIR